MGPLNFLRRDPPPPHYRGWQFCVDEKGHTYLGKPGGPRDNAGDYWSNGIPSSEGVSAMKAARDYNEAFLNGLLPEVKAPEGYTFLEFVCVEPASLTDYFNVCLLRDGRVQGMLLISGPDGGEHGTDRVFVLEDKALLVDRIERRAASQAKRLAEYAAEKERDAKRGEYLDWMLTLGRAA